MLFNHSFIVLMLLALVACSSSKTSVEAPFGSTEQQTDTLSLLESHLADRFYQALEVSDSELFYLSDVQKQTFDQFYHNERYAHLSETDRFSEYLTTRLVGFTYDGETFTASEAFEKMSGNCLSLAILTTALAEHAGLEIRYQQVNAPPVYEKHGTILLLSTHVRTRVYGPQPVKKEGLISTRPYVTIDYFPVAGDVRGELISRDSFMVMYHRNMAAKALIKKQHDLAYAYVKKGLSYQGSHVETYNLLSVLYNKTGHTDMALSLYAELLTRDDTSLNAIENYANLLEKTGQNELALHYLSQIDSVNDKNPYQWLALAQQHLTNNNLRLAIKYALRAEELAPYLHTPHFLLAKVYYEQRKFGASRQSLMAALSLAKYTEDESLYQAKLYALKNL